MPPYLESVCTALSFHFRPLDELIQPPRTRPRRSVQKLCRPSKKHQIGLLFRIFENRSQCLLELHTRYFFLAYGYQLISRPHDALGFGRASLGNFEGKYTAEFRVILLAM